MRARDNGSLASDHDRPLEKRRMSRYRLQDLGVVVEVERQPQMRQLRSAEELLGSHAETTRQVPEL